MDTIRWIEQVRLCMEQLGSRAFQEQTWIGRDPQRASSFEEVICSLYDDALLEAFLQDRAIGETLEASLIGDLRAFAERLSSYAAALPDHPSPAAVLADSEWSALQREAAVLAQRFPCGGDAIG